MSIAGQHLSPAYPTCCPGNLNLLEMRTADTLSGRARELPLAGACPYVIRCWARSSSRNS